MTRQTDESEKICNFSMPHAPHGTGQDKNGASICFLKKNYTRTIFPESCYLVVLTLNT